MKKSFNLLIVGLVIGGLVLGITGYLVSQAASVEHPSKPNIHKPVPATDVEIIKKITIKGQPAGKGKPATQAATGTLGEPLPSGAQKYAIVIGISDYPGTAYDLKYADDDAEEMFTALTTLYGFSGDNIKRFIDKEGTEASKGTLVATRANILAGIEDLKGKIGPNDEVVFFFSGHGGRGRAADGDKEAIDESIISHDGINLVHIWDGELKTAFSEFASSKIVFIFDSCVAGGMIDLAATGRIINMATTENGTAYEFEVFQNGEFTYFFVDKGMIQGWADKYDNIVDVPDVTVEEAFDYSKANCKDQTPTIKDSFINDLLL